MKISIIGGGITGCIVALVALRKGYTVSLYEKDERLGGIMKDIWINNDCFFNNCHYLENDNAWLKNFKPILSESLYDFNHIYSSITDFSENVIIQNNFAQPVFNIKFNKNEFNNIRAKSVLNRIRSYPFSISNKLQKWSSNFGPIDKLHIAGINSMQIGRIMIKKDNDIVFKHKKIDKNIDDLLGLPYDKLYPKHPKILSSIPHFGYDAFFSNIYSILIKNGCKLFFSENINCKYKNKNLSFFNSSKEEILADKFIWTGNPTKIINSTNTKKLSPNLTKMLTIVGSISKYNNKHPIYHQIFSLKNSIFRVFIYKIKSIKFTIEAFDKQLSEKQIYEDIKYIFELLSINQYKISGIYKQNRYNYLTINDYNLLKDFKTDKKLMNNHWHLYSRDDKIEYITSQL